MPPKRHAEEGGATSPLDACSGLSTGFSIAGLALALGLAFLKIANLPCTRWNCAPVIQSSYGTWRGAPVGAYAAALWLGVFLSGRGSVRLACLAALGLGSLYFTGVQIFALRSFCPYCCAHAAASWGALIATRERPWRGGIIVAVALAAVASAWAYTTSSRQPEKGRAARVALVRNPGDGLFWLGPRSPQSPVLVLSLTCPACLDLLSKLAQGDIANASAGPAIFFKTDPDNRAETRAFIAAVLSRTGDPKDSFLAIATVALGQRDLLLSDPQRGAQVLRQMLPAGDEFESEADQLLQRQAQALAGAGVETTPLLIEPDGIAAAERQLVERLVPRR